MPEIQSIGQSLCGCCHQPLGFKHHVFAFQQHQIAYTLPGATPSEQAFLQPSTITPHTLLCGAECAEKSIPGLLRAMGLPASLAGNSLGGGPIYPCGKCGKPVNVTEPHGAWISGPVSSDNPQDESNAPDWFDMLTVLCKSCGAAWATESRAAEVGLPQQASFEDLLRALARIDEEAEEDEGVERCRPLQEPFNPSC